MNENTSRWSQAQLLIAALFSVVFAGEMPEQDPLRSPRDPRYPESLTRDELALCQNGKKYNGVFKSVAKKLGVSSTSVSIVAHGRARSRRIISELRVQMALVDSLPRVEIIPLTESEMSAFRKGGRYFGLHTSLAAKHKVSRSLFSAAARHPYAYKKRFLVLREEMARIDAKLANRGGAR